MAQRYRSYSARRLIRKSRRNLIITCLLIITLLYATINWALPSFVNMLGEVNNIVKPAPKRVKIDQLNSTLAPPILNIPFESTNTAKINISGYANPNAKVKIFVDDKAITTISVLEDGSFTAKEIDLNFGTNSIFSKSIDEEGKESLSSKTFKIIFDNEQPSLSVNEPEDNKNVAGERKLKISGKTEPGAQVFVNNAQVIVDKDGNFSTIVQLADGDNYFSIKAQDHAVNFKEISRKVTFQP
ncbi:hypothetical protein HYZ05_02495 [Candidatus Daviesbacteria bacterium]|nr:hypothetical protein [Candidatus Daviesbacteria bacterium]